MVPRGERRKRCLKTKKKPTHPRRRKHWKKRKRKKHKRGRRRRAKPKPVFGPIAEKTIDFTKDVIAMTTVASVGTFAIGEVAKATKKS